MCQRVFQSSGFRWSTCFPWRWRQLLWLAATSDGPNRGAMGVIPAAPASHHLGITDKLKIPKNFSVQDLAVGIFSQLQWFEATRYGRIDVVRWRAEPNLRCLRLSDSGKFCRGVGSFSSLPDMSSINASLCRYPEPLQPPKKEETAKAATAVPGKQQPGSKGCSMAMHGMSFCFVTCNGIAVILLHILCTSLHWTTLHGLYHRCIKSRWNDINVRAHTICCIRLYPVASSNMYTS